MPAPSKESGAKTRYLIKKTGALYYLEITSVNLLPMRHTDISLREVRAILVVLEEGSMSQAASRLHSSQPAVSRLIKNAEEKLGITLFERRTSGIVPHLEAVTIFERLRQIQSYLYALSHEIAVYSRSETSSNLHRQVSLRHFRAFVAVYNAGSIGAAAHHIGQSGTAVGRSLRDLESLTASQLFERQPSPFTLTEAGEVVIHYAKVILHEVRYIGQELDIRRGQIAGDVAIGSMQLAKSMLIPEMVTRLERKHSDLRFNITEGPYQSLLDSLLCGDLDIMIGALRQPAPSTLVQETPLFMTPLSLVVRNDHPLLRQEKVDIETLWRARWIFPPPGTPARHHIEHFFTQAGYPSPRPVVECSSPDATREILLRSEWIAVITRELIEQEEQLGTLQVLPVDLKGAERTIGVTMRTDSPMAPATAALLDELRGICDRLIQQGKVLPPPSTELAEH